MDKNLQYPIIRTGLGQDSHRFLPQDSSKPLIICGVIIDEEGTSGFNANSDGDVVYHSICNAITSLTGVPIMGALAEELLQRDGITDSEVYLREAFYTLGKQKITHVACAIEAKKPSLREHLMAMKQNLARILELHISQVGITITSGKGLTDFGCGDGVQCLTVVTTVEL